MGQTAKGRAPTSESLTWFPPRHCWRKMIGGRVFYFGPDQGAAESEAAAIRARWRRVKAEGKRSWPDGEPDRTKIQEALGIGPGAASSIGPAANGAAPAITADDLISPTALTVHDTANLYMQSQRTRATAAERTLSDLKFRLGKAVDALGRTKRLGDVRKPELEQLMGNMRRKIKAGDMSSIYARHQVAALKAMLVWAADHEDIGWHKPSGFDDLLLIDTRKPMTDAEREALEERIFNPEVHFHTVRQLRTLYRAADARMRAFILLGLNCAYYPSDIGFLQASKIKTDGAIRIETTRRKTNTPCRHVLWPETIAAIEAARAADNPGGWLFLNARGRPYQGNSVKFIPKLWGGLRKSAKLPDAPDFKFLRHTSGNEIKKIAGGEISEIHLAHREGLKMQGPYTERLWDEHAKATRKLRSVFRTVWS
jgi:hypothetical protein